MANRQKRASKPKAKARKTVDYWKFHDNYRSNRFGFESLITRSQTAFNRIRNDDSDLNLFCDPLMHEPMDKPHIMVVLKGQYGCIPRTIITRSTLQHLKVNKELCKRLDEYKDKNLREEHIQELKEYQQDQMAKPDEQPLKSGDQPMDMTDEQPMDVPDEQPMDVPDEQPMDVSDDQSMDESEDPDIRKKLIEELKEYQQEHMTKTPAHDEQQPKSDDQPMDETEALEVQEKRKEERMEVEEQQPLTKKEWIQQFNAAADYYNDSIEIMEDGSVKPVE